ncbi:MAG: hypothetical protein ACREQA_13150 [Candidatus Binatia bacterium]
MVRKKGGAQIEYGDEDARIHQEFEGAVAKGTAFMRKREAKIHDYFA